MKLTPNERTALWVAPLVAPVVFTVVLAFPGILEGAPGFFEALFVVPFVGVPLSYIVEVVFGLPLFLLARKFQLVGFWSLSFGGAVVAMLPMLLGFFVGVSFRETSYAWALFSVLAGCGFSVGVVFWAVAYYLPHNTLLNRSRSANALPWQSNALFGHIMQFTRRERAALLVAPLAAPIVMSVVVGFRGVPEGTPGGFIGALFLITTFGAMPAYIVELVFFLPIFLLLRKLQLVALWSLTCCGAVVGMFPNLLMWFLDNPYRDASDALDVFSVFAVCGFVAGAMFWGVAYYQPHNKPLEPTR
jgi:hypothetical protein